MVVTHEEWGGQPFDTGDIGPPEPLDPETVKETVGTLKKFFPYLLAFGVAALVKHFRKPGEQLPSGSLIAFTSSQ